MANAPEEPAKPEEPNEPDKSRDRDRKYYRWLEPAPTYVDHSAVALFSGQRVMRLAFGEWIGKDIPPIYRVGLVLPLSEARELVRSLTEELEQYDAKIAAARAKAQVKK